MKFYNKILLSLLVITFIAGNFTLFAAKKRVTWLMYSYPSMYNVRGNYLAQGYGDKMIAYFISKMPEYKHSITQVTTQRLMAEWEKDGSCSGYVWLHFLKGKIVYSKAFSTTPPMGIVVLKKNQNLFGKQGVVLSLQNLLKNNALTLGTLKIYTTKDKKASRYPILHPYLSPYIGKQNLFEYIGSENQLSTKFLDFNRVQYMIQLPEYISVQEKINSIEKKYLFYNLKEHHFYKKIGTACSNTELGKDVVAKINKLLTPKTILKFIDYVQEWNGNNQIYKQKMVDYYINGKDDPDIQD